MKRAAVCIGVARTVGGGGSLPPLKLARKGAEDLHEWARKNGIDSHLITDAAGRVTVAQLRDKIKELLEPGSLDQLIVYFSGHGVNVRGDEYWLLSGSTADDEAINLAAAAARARYCGVSHVVFVSDACRTAPEGTQAQSMYASPLFPNNNPDGLEKKVDIFWACILGAPSLEIKDPDDAARRHAVFTDEMLSALKGTYPNLLEKDPPALVLRPWPLADFLEKRVPLRVGQILGPATPVTQQPDARITSRPTAWLSRFDAPPAADDALESFGITEETRVPARGVPMAPSSPLPPTIVAAARDAVRTAIDPDTPTLNAIRDLHCAVAPGAGAIAIAVESDVALTGPDHMESMCGFKIRGAALRDAYAERIPVEPLEPWLVRVWPDRPAHDVLLELDDGRAVMLPGIRGFITTLSFEEGELRNVAYEPSANDWRWGAYVAQKEELAMLRSLIAASANVGGFRLAGTDAEKLTDRIRVAKGLDPTMALYAAYSYYNLGLRDPIRDMQRYVRGDLEITLFDLAVLADRRLVDPQRTFPLVPMLAQGWSLVDAFSIQLMDGLANLKRYVGPSLWTVFAPEAVGALRNAMRGRIA